MAPPSRQPVIAAAIDASFNAILLEAFLCGLYTLLFGYILHALLRKQNKKAYATVLSFLWVIVMLTFALDWQYHRTAFVINNNSPVDIANSVLGVGIAKWIVVCDNVLSWSSYLLADALLIWRCYILWEHKKWILFPFPILFTAGIVLGCLFNASQFKDVNQANNFIFTISFFAVSITITFMGTSLIILRMQLVTRNSPLSNHTSAYRKIQRVLVESGILYTIMLLITGVTLGIQVTASNPLSVPLADSVLTTYTEAVLIPVSGIAPTLIAIRVGREAPLQTDGGTSRTQPRSRIFSHLAFRRTVRQNSTFDIERGVSGYRESPINSSIEQRNHGNIEKTSVPNSDPIF